MERNKIIINTSIKGIIVNILLVIFKMIIGLIANSIAIILDAVNNLTDALSSIITIIGTLISNKRPDKEHPFGHGRVEYFTSVIISVIILIAGLTALKESVSSIIKPADTNYSIYSLIIITVAILVKFFFGKYVKKIGKNIYSDTLVASGSDAIFDSVLSLATLIGAIVNILFNIKLEGILGLIISIFIIKASIEMLKETINELIGTRIDSELAKKIKNKVNSYKEVEGAYDLLLHNYGPMNKIGSLHIQVPDKMTAKEIHKLTREIEVSIFNELGIIITIGIYASNTSDTTSSQIKKDLNKIIKKYKQVLQLHGFYVDTKKKIINFDIIIDFNEKNPNEIKDNIVKEIKSKYPEYDYFVIIDNDYSD